MVRKVLGSDPGGEVGCCSSVWLVEEVLEARSVRLDAKGGRGGGGTGWFEGVAFSMRAQVR